MRNREAGAGGGEAPAGDARAAGGVPKGDESRCGSDAPEKARAPRPAPSTFQVLYESRDKRLCLFESRDGHLSAVDASKLA